ncbi:hypothetical protein [Actinomadura verrucosospora]|uniref:Uncharacterized protein n=1 Tax=Actinomadura verrucosospora TaxID=46165 RepID=A0A7D3VZA7_ACTVE|nr:hypothetical protein [Actinomadura verrucosospora]QKG27180.1 hypothetical protein ACTIVE_8833 [Actinomadura verrucosospora]
MSNDTVAALWAAHRAAPFPGRLRRIEGPSGESVPALDAYLAGCIHTFLANDGALDPERRRILTDCAADLAALLGSLTEQDAVYVSRLLRAADLISARS